MNELPPEQWLRCKRCGHDRAEHHAANLSDGNLVGAFLLICPTAVFQADGHDVFGRPWARPQTPAAVDPVVTERD